MNICTESSHPKLYSSERKIYFCPFCRDNPPASTAYNIAKDIGFDLHDYQGEILESDGHRVLVGARQTGKSLTAELEVAVKSQTSTVTHIYRNRPRESIRQYVNPENVRVIKDPIDMAWEGIAECDFLVVDDINIVKNIEQTGAFYIADTFKGSLITGTPLGKGILKRYSKMHPYKSWQIPMREAPHISPSKEGEMRQQMNPESEKREIDAEFV